MIVPIPVFMRLSHQHDSAEARTRSMASRNRAPTTTTRIDLLLTEGHLTRRRFGPMLARIAPLPYRRDRWIVIQSATESVHNPVRVRRRVARVGHKWAVLGCTGVDGGPSGVVPMKLVSVLRTGKTGVLWCRFPAQKGNSALNLSSCSW